MMYKPNLWSVTAIAGLIFSVLNVKAADIENCTDSHQYIGPIITPCQSEIILQMGQNYTLSCKGKHKLQFVQQEIYEELSGNFKVRQSIVSSTDPDYPFETSLYLYNIDRFAVGFYACFENLNITEARNILNNLKEEPKNTQNISFIYIYVNGTDSLFAPMSEIIISRQDHVLIECKPTIPDVQVTLFSSQTQHQPNVTYYPKIGFIMNECGRSAYQCKGLRGKENETKHIRYVKPPPNPTVHGGFKYFLEGETFTINCTVPYESGVVINLLWVYPQGISQDNNIYNVSTNEYEMVNDKLFKNITIVNATKEHAGTYTCISKNSCGSKHSIFVKNFLEKAYINVSSTENKPFKETSQRKLQLTWEIKAYPPVEYYFLKNGYKIYQDSDKYTLWKRDDTGEPVLKINNVTIYDTANYTLVVYNKYVTKNSTIDLRVSAPPNVTFVTKKEKIMANKIASFKCDVTGYILPTVLWKFSADGQEETMKSTKSYVSSLFTRTEYLDTLVLKSGNITCIARNDKGLNLATQPLLLYDVTDGFDFVDKEKTWFSENENVALQCLASIYDYTNVTWLKSDGEPLETMVEYKQVNYSHAAILKINEISLSHAGNYSCEATSNNGERDERTITITVAAHRPPIIREPKVDRSEAAFEKQHVQLNCQVDGVPPPQLNWFKDGMPLKNSSDVHIYTTKIDQTITNSTIEINQMHEKNEGKYECRAVTDTDQESKYIQLSIKVDTDDRIYLSGIAIIIIAFIVIVLYLTWKIRKEKKFRKELAAAGLLYFKEGVTKSLNPDLGIDEQAELLPYDEKFEFPPEKLVLGKQLGAGAFGVVYKADARGIIDAEETTPVAVKMVKKTADNMYIKALASELKIMVHMGKHVNIVNLLGACTKNVGKRELIVIVEYCKFGNIHNYMQRHREVFIDQLTDNKEQVLGKVNKGFLNSTGSAGLQSEYLTSSSTQDTDHTFVNTANSQRSNRKDNPKPAVEPKQVSEGYVQPEWRSNYESDYSYYDCRNPRPLTSRDLLAWAFQIARGMEYLASRKVLHGDLAARNVLLAEDNIVKICDFGLARSIYKNDEYQKKENSPLPVKWLAIECMADRIFSTQSDVWSFGIVLWEMFSLAKTPYPNISPPNLLQWLNKGILTTVRLIVSIVQSKTSYNYLEAKISAFSVVAQVMLADIYRYRLEKPPYADDRLYGVMTRCWQQKPTARPSFTELQEILGTFLEDNVRNHYVDLNSRNMAMNTQQQGVQDYLDMVCAPDYNNLVTPSPHHYVNVGKSFFPTTPVPLDEDGYLQMSPATNKAIFSPRPQNTTFDFDARKFNPRPSKASSGGSELTPMLTSNDLPAMSGSESDHEGTLFPDINVICSRIEEESDEVFETKQNNVKNAQNNIAVSNPTYAYNIEIDKKPKDIINNYVNMDIPNGLVK